MDQSWAKMAAVKQPEGQKQSNNKERGWKSSKSNGPARDPPYKVDGRPAENAHDPAGIAG